jgi:uncharacterized damage-inducible protein DinB
MPETARVADLITRVIDGDPWHGSTVLALLHGVSHQTAAGHPIPGVHSIWELVLHMTGWATEAGARLAGEAAGEPKGGDWPAVTDVSPAAWTRAVTALVVSHQVLAAAVRGSDDRVLDTAVRDPRDRAAGTGLSRYLTLHGLVHHTTYHAGQIAVLVRAAQAMK